MRRLRNTWVLHFQPSSQIIIGGIIIISIEIVLASGWQKSRSSLCSYLNLSSYHCLFFIVKSLEKEKRGQKWDDASYKNHWNDEDSSSCGSSVFLFVSLIFQGRPGNDFSSAAVGEDEWNGKSNGLWNKLWLSTGEIFDVNRISDVLEGKFECRMSA